MKLPHRRQFLHLAAGAAALPAMSRVARAQTYPSRPVRIIVPYAPAGAPDIVARLMGQWLSERLGQPFIIENRPGAGGNIGTEAVVRARPDGYTLVYVVTANAISATLFDNLNFNFIRDIAPVAGIIRVPNLVSINLSLPVNTIPQLVAYAKAHPGKLNFGAGKGGTVPLSGALFNLMAGVNIVHVPYSKQTQAVTDLLANQMQVSFDVMPTTIEYVRTGKLRALAVTTAARSRLSHFGGDMYGVGRLSPATGGHVSTTAEKAEDAVVRKELLDLADVCEEVANNIEDRLASG